MDIKLLKNLPSPFYRVTLKALIKDSQDRLLIGKGEQSSTGWELPGGGFEHDESIEECLKREIKEELGAEIEKISGVSFVYRGKSINGWVVFRVAIPVRLKGHAFRYGDFSKAKFVTKKELLETKFAADEGTIKNEVEKIWPA